MGLYSLEPLSGQIVETIERSIGHSALVVNRDNFLESKNIHVDVTALIARDKDPIGDIIDNCPNLRFIFIVSTGVENLPFKKLSAHNIIVCNTGGINSVIMADFTMGYILSHSINVIENYVNQTQHYWKPYQCIEPLTYKTLLIVGAGRTGQLIAKRAKAFDIRTIGVKKHIIDNPYFDKIVSLSEINSVIPLADYIVCTIPLTPETKDLFTAARFSLMKKTAIFINISRGGVVSESSLERSLNNGHIGGAVLDVFEHEPIDSSSNIWDTPNMLISPHSAGRLKNFIDLAIQDYFIPNYKAFLMNKTMKNIINLADGY